MMTEKRFYITDTGLGLDTESDEMYSFGDEEDFCRLFDKLNEQQSTISALKDIFKDIITYSEWDSKKPYCSLGISVDRKTYYKIREILNE